MMKKLLSLLLALAMLLGCAAMAETAAVDYTGVWTMTALETGGVTMDMAALAQAGVDMTITLNADGTVVMASMGETQTGTWVATETGIAITDATETVQIAYVNDTLRIEEAGAAVILTRGEAAAQASSAVQADANAATYDYTGAWILTGAEMLGVSVDLATLGLSAYVDLYEDGTCVMSMSGETQEGTWAATDTGITTTDADGVVDAYTLSGGNLIAETTGMKLIFMPYAPMTGLTAADFNGVWNFTYLEVYDYTAMTQDYYDASDLDTSIVITLEDGKGTMTETIDGVTETYNAEGVVDTFADGASVMYFMFLDETGAQDGSGVMLMMYPAAELVWYDYDSEADVEYYFNFALAQ